MTIVALLLMLFAIKHYLADKYFQTNWMVEGKRRRGLSFVGPLAAHCGIHAILTITVILCVAALLVSPVLLVWALPCGVFDFSAHFLMDRLKGVMTRPRRIRGAFGISCQEQRSPQWMRAWMVADQAFHVLTYFAIIAFLLG